MRRRGAAVTAALLLALVPSEASATPNARLVYSRSHDAASCAGEGALRTAVASRVGYDPFFAYARQTIVVQIARRGTGFAARVQLVDAQGISHGTRELSSARDDCSEIFNAAALAISIALEEAVASQPQDESVAGEAPAAPAAAAPAPTAPALAPPPAEVVPPPPPAVPTAPAAVVREVPPRAPVHPKISLGAEVVAALGTGPSLAPGGAMFAELTGPYWSVGVELLAEGAESAARSIEVGGGAARAAIYAAAVAPCARYGVAAVCAVGYAGVEDASGRDVTPSVAASAAFLAAGVRLAVAWPLSRVLSIRARVDGVANLHRTTLVLGDDAVYAAPLLASIAGVGIAVNFP